MNSKKRPSLTSNNKVIGITLGDPAGIGPEIVAKSLKQRSFSRVTFVIIGDDVLFKKYNIKEEKRRILINCRNFSQLHQIKKGVFKKNGAAALSYLHKAVTLLRQKKNSYTCHRAYFFKSYVSII